MSIPYSSVVVLLALVVAHTPASTPQKGPRPPVVGPRGASPIVLQTTEGLRLAWDYLDRDLAGEYQATEETKPIPYKVTEFRVSWGAGLPEVVVGMPVLTAYDGGKTYATPFPPGPWAIGVHTLALRSCATPAAVPCSEPSTVAFTVDPPPAYAVTVAPNTTTAAATVTITFNCARDCGQTDWILMVPLGQTAAVPLWSSAPTGGKASGSFTAPASACTPGKCSIHYCLNAAAICPVGTALEVTAAGPIDCVVGEWGPWSEWSEWQPIDQALEGRSRTRTRPLTPPQNHGAECPAGTETETETRPRPAPLLPPTATATRCNWQLTANPPDAAGGWRAQFRQDGQNVGNADGSPPYSRNVQVDAGGPYAFSVVWTKAGQTAQTTGNLTKPCQ